MCAYELTVLEFEARGEGCGSPLVMMIFAVSAMRSWTPPAILAESAALAVLSGCSTIRLAIVATCQVAC
jgi:hypothetical protein